LRCKTSLSRRRNRIGSANDSHSPHALKISPSQSCSLLYRLHSRGQSLHLLLQNHPLGRTLERQLGRPFCGWQKVRKNCSLCSQSASQSALQSLILLSICSHALILFILALVLLPFRSPSTLFLSSFSRVLFSFWLITKTLSFFLHSLQSLSPSTRFNFTTSAQTNHHREGQNRLETQAFSSIKNVMVFTHALI